MNILLLSFLVIGLAVAGMSIGVLFGRKPLQGSCGGLSNFREGADCEFCGGQRSKCESLNRQSSQG